ncbi:LINE-1 retrotransposable element ORF2 protein [Linum grandiflorum]
MLNDFIFDHELLDLPLVGANFTWSNLRESPSLSRIDRALVNASFESTFSDCRLIALSWICSDHRAIFLDCGDRVRVKRPWRFESMWKLHDDFLPFVERSWEEAPRGPSCLFLFSRKLKWLKEKLKVWNKEVFGHIETQVTEVSNKIFELDTKEEDNFLTDDERIYRCLLKNKLDELWRREEVSWRQKSKNLWLKEGDKNTSFFHRCANERNRRNWIDRIAIGGQIFVGHSEVAGAIANHFKRFFEDIMADSHPFPYDLDFRIIASNAADSLTGLFSEAEILHAINSSEGDKAPGPDGFNLTFFKTCWPILKEDLVEAINHFHTTGFIPKAINSSFICLIPKKESIGNIRDLRPISLIGSTYKILSKCLMFRFRNALKEVIAPNQCAFLEGRQITEASLLANEVIDSRRASGKNGLVFKLDLEKAFDTVCWSSILKSLVAFGFTEKWVMWVKACISSVHFSVMVNGEPTSYFRNWRGIRQGDSLSPYLFICAMEILTRMLNKAKEIGWIRGFHMNERTNLGEINHLLYADDTLLFCEANEDQVVILHALRFGTPLSISFSLDWTRGKLDTFHLGVVWCWSNTS